MKTVAEWWETFNKHDLGDGTVRVTYGTLKDFQAAAEAELQSTLDLIIAADRRAIQVWQEAHPGNDLVWPDRGKMIFWLLEQLEGSGRIRMAEGYPIDAYNNCAECGGGPEGSIPHDRTCKHYVWEPTA